MKRFTPLFLTFVLALFAFTPMSFAASGTPGDGFQDGDDCAFLMGQGENYNDHGEILVDAMTDRDQACVTESGYMYALSDPLKRSMVRHSAYGNLDLAWSQDSSNHVWVDPATGYWQGYGRFTSSTITGSDKWVWFDWTCDDVTCTDEVYEEMRVRTDLETGETTGYAWSDLIGDYISFNGIEMEVWPRRAVVYVDFFMGDSDLGPDDGDMDTWPIADGYDYIRTRVQVVDSNGDFLTEDDFDSLSLELQHTSDTKIYIDQRNNVGDAIIESAANPSIPGCVSATDYCLMVEDDGSVSFNMFTYSVAPTSAAVGINDDEDTALEYLTDRDGCLWIYESLYSGNRPPCTSPDLSSTTPDKGEVYYDRGGERNYYELDALLLQMEFASGREVILYEDSQFEANDEGYLFTPDADDAVWNFAPRFRVQQLEAYYDDDFYKVISDDTNETMELIVDADILPPSSHMMDVVSNPIMDLTLDYQLDVDSSTDPELTSDLFLMMDVDGDLVLDDIAYTEALSPPGVPSEYTDSFAMGYDQLPEYCSPDPCGPPTNTISAPTAELWVCDEVGEYRKGDPSCYYVGYLSIQDPHADAGDMYVSGAINSTLDESGLFTEDERVSVLGNINSITLRNKMYAQIARFTLGQRAGGGDVDLSDPTNGNGVVSLMNGRLLFAQSDVTITEGEDACNGGTLVLTSGDLYVEDNITCEQWGIIVLGGGNMYVGSNVTELYTNIYLDGTLFGEGDSVDADGVPKWDSELSRFDGTMNQLYLRGSLNSRNTINGAVDDGAGTWNKGDGTTTNSYETAVEYDLNKLRQFRLCYPYNSAGLPDTGADPERCYEGEEMSSYGEDNEIYGSFIIDYRPAGDLPIFVVESGLFN